MLQHDSGDFPSDCERFCNDNNPLSTKLSSVDADNDAVGGFLAAPISSANLVPTTLTARLDRLNTTVAAAVSVLQTSQRLAL